LKLNFKSSLLIVFLLFNSLSAVAQKERYWYLYLKSSLRINIGRAKTELKLSFHNPKFRRITFDKQVYACQVAIKMDSCISKSIVYEYDMCSYYWDPRQIENRMESKVVSFNIPYSVLKDMHLQSGDKGEIEFIFPYFEGKRTEPKDSIINSAIYVGAHHISFNGNFIVDGPTVKIKGVCLY
jgi:hypothetical protein